jgi:hypothetical protein
LFALPAALVQKLDSGFVVNVALSCKGFARLAGHRTRQRIDSAAPAVIYW